MTTLNKQIIHFDTANSTYNNITNGVSNSFNTNFKLAYTLQKVQKISLKSVELPVAFCNGRFSNTILSFGILSASKPVYFNTASAYTTSFTLTSSILTLSEQNFNSITDLITAINAYLISVWTSADLPVPYFSFNTTTNKVQLTVNLWFDFGATNATSNYYQFFLNDSYLLNTVLGYNKNNVTISQSNQTYSANPNISTSTIGNSNMQQFIYTFNNPYSLFNDNYLNLTINNLPFLTANANQKPCSFKIPLNISTNTYFFSGENTSFIQPIVLDNPNFVLDNLNIVITDRFGNPINSNGFDYSCSLQFE